MDDPVEPMLDEPTASAKQSPALTIQIHSWATPIIGLVMLVVGALGGFFLRPVIVPLRAQPTSTAQIAAVAPTQAAAAPNAAEIMTMVEEQTRHYAGPEGAKVTIIEFSDFQ